MPSSLTLQRKPGSLFPATEKIPEGCFITKLELLHGLVVEIRIHGTIRRLRISKKVKLICNGKPSILVLGIKSSETMTDDGSFIAWGGHRPEIKIKIPDFDLFFHTGQTAIDFNHKKDSRNNIKIFPKE